MKPPPKSGGTNRRPTAVRSRGKEQFKNPVPVVGIGASAGGLEAFRALLEALPMTTGAAYVLVQHLDPHHESMLAELLARSTHIPVIEVKHRTSIKPDHIYVISPGKNMALQNSVLTLTQRSKKGGPLNMPIDHFFRSLALARKEKAIGVVLSGTASDGTVGLGAIKEAGGLTFVQNSTAKYQGMPQAAISAGVADYVLSPRKIAEELVSLTKYPLSGVHEPVSTKERLSGGGDYPKIIAELLRATGVDLSHYKATTLTRRITRRMLVNKTTTPHEYLNLLRGNAKEAEALLNDVLINVTGFFRDPAALHCLVRKALPQLVENKNAKEPLRVWVAGCSTGEEVYSLTITLLEFLGDKSLSTSVQIFGTDLSSTAVDKARRGTYTRSEVNNISAQRLERFFLKTNGAYQIKKHVRDICVFSVHNLIKDPPFSRMDIVSCCNVLIYMDTTLQRKIFSALHYALVPNGALVLGKSETVGSAPGLFSQIEKKNKVFIKKAGTKRRGIPAFIQSDQAVSALHTPSKRRSANVVAKESDVRDEADTVLLGRFTPASVLINADSEILQFWGGTQKSILSSHQEKRLSIF